MKRSHPRWGLSSRSVATVLLAMGQSLFPFPDLQAQAIVGHVLDRESAIPVEGALVLLLDPGGEEVGGALSAVDGRFVLRSQIPGEYLLRVERLGYETTTTGPFTLNPGQTFQPVLRVAQKALELEGLKVEGERRCVVRPEEGLVLSAFWEEAQKALRNQDWGDQEGLVRFSVSRYERDLDPGLGLILGEVREPPQWVTGNPIRSLPVEDLVEGGFIRSESDGYRYFGPDAGVLLSHRFLDTHCFRLEDRPGPPGLVGLAFQPVGGGPAREITGVLWVGEQDARPHFLEYRYTSSPWAEAEGVAEGRVEFEEIAGGIWIVRRWWIRMPKMIRDETLMVRGRSGLRVGSILEVGGEVTRIADRGRAAPVTGDPRSDVEGMVLDSLHGEPLKGAEVYLSGTSFKTLTDSAGGFRLTGVPLGTHHLTFRHPRLEAMGAYPVGREIHVTEEEVTEATLSGPTMEAILAALCSGAVQPDGQSAVVGTVRAGSTGAPVPGATIRLEWTDYRAAGGREIQADVQMVEVSSDHRGRFRACGIPPGALVAARATVPEGESGVERMEVGRGTVAIARLEITGEPDRDLPTEPCEGLEEQATWGGIHGRIVDAGTAVPIGRTTVWLVPDGEGGSASALSDAEGRFTFCNVEPGSYTVRTALRGVGDGRVPVTVRAAEMAGADLRLLLGDGSQETGRIGGKVVTEAGDPLPGTEVRLQSGATTITGADGTFSFGDVPVGPTSLHASFLGYQDSQGELVVGGGQTLILEIRLSLQPIELEPIVVVGVRFSTGGILADVNRRATSAWGTVLLGEELEQRQARATRTTDMLQGLGATVTGNGTALFLRRTQCAPHVYLDGVKVTRIPRSISGKDPRDQRDGPQTEAASALNMVHPSEIAALEVYRGPAETPGEFLDSDARCGIILVWTKRSGG